MEIYLIGIDPDREVVDGFEGRNLFLFGYLREINGYPEDS
jgi:hypothetical protein